MCLRDWREFPGWEDLTPQYIVLLPGLLHWFSKAAFLYTEYYVSDDKVPPQSVWWLKEWCLQPATESVTPHGFLISCHWAHCTSWCCWGSVSVHFTALPAYLLKSACCFANWEFLVCEDEQALLERFLLSGYSKKTERINHQQSNPRRIPIKPRLWTPVKLGNEPTMSNHCQQPFLHNEPNLDLKTKTSKPSSIWRPETSSVFISINIQLMDW